MSTSQHATTRRSFRTLKTRRNKKMSQKIWKYAKKNYPDIWNDECLRNLVALGQLTQAEYEDVTEKPYEPGTDD